MPHRSRPVGALILALTAPALLGAALPGDDVTVTVTGIRSHAGKVVACMTAHADKFPDCQRDPQARHAEVSAAATVQLDFGRVSPGRYAIALFHDENDNGKLDKRLMMPREGYGFSRDAPVRLGPPRFANAVFVIGGAAHHETIKMRYLF